MPKRPLKTLLVVNETDETIYVYLLEDRLDEKRGISIRLGPVFAASDHSQDEFVPVGSKQFVLPYRPNREFYVHARTVERPNEGRTWGDGKRFTITLGDSNPYTLALDEPAKMPSWLQKHFVAQVRARGNKIGLGGPNGGVYIFETKGTNVAHEE